MLRDKNLIPLSHQHQHALALCVLTNRSLKENRGADNVAKLAAAIVDRYEVELVNHFQVEEEILFPAFESELTRALTSEHRMMEELVNRLRGKATAGLIEDFIQLLQLHVRKEEDELFEQMQKVLGRETLDRLGQEIDRKVIRVCL